MPLQTILKNGDLVSIETSKNASPSLHWLSSSATGKARSAIRRYWQDKSLENSKPKDKKFDWSSDCNSTVKIRSTAEPQIIKRPKFLLVSDI